MTKPYLGKVSQDELKTLSKLSNKITKPKKKKEKDHEVNLLIRNENRNT